DPGKTALVAGGTTGNDVIVFVPVDCEGAVLVVISDGFAGIFRPTGRLIAFGQAGNDDIVVAGGIRLTAGLYGGAGPARPPGGAGTDIVVGGEGDDRLVGGAGRDILIGVLGSDRIVGDTGDDILIAGTTDYDARPEALRSILGEWTSAADFATRVNNLRAGA